MTEKELQKLAELSIIADFMTQIIEAGYNKLFKVVECLPPKSRVRYRKFLNIAKKTLEDA